MNTRSTPPAMRARRAATAAVAALGCVGLLGTAAACGGDSVSDKVSDKIGEQIAEHGAPEGTDVDIDTSGDDAFMQVQNDDGTSMAIGGGDVPDGFPSEIPLPGDYTVGMAMSDSDGEITLSLTTPESMSSVTGAIADAVDSGAYERDGHSTTSMGGLQQESFTLIGGGDTVSVLVSRADDTTSVTYNVTPEDG